MGRTLSEIKELYWGDFMLWWDKESATGDEIKIQYYANNHWIDYPLEDLFWKWIVKVKLPSLKTSESWSDL